MLKIDLSSLDQVTGTSADSLNAWQVFKLTDSFLNAILYRFGLLSENADDQGLIDGFDLTLPIGFRLQLTGTNGDDTFVTGRNNDVVYGREGDDTISGGRGNDTLDGGADNDTLNGDEGNDILYGGTGDDALYGGIGNDILSGGAGTDTLSGGEGADSFTFTADSAFSALDTIADFNAAEGDTIDISDILTAFDPLADAITDFVRVLESAGDSFISVDADGGGDTFQFVAIASNATGLTDEQALLDNGTLIV